MNPWAFPTGPVAFPLVIDAEPVGVEPDSDEPGPVDPTTLRPRPGQVPNLGPAQRLPVWAGPVCPDLPGSGPDSPEPRWWWLGCHGGAGVSTLATLVPGGADAVRRWPDPGLGGPPHVLLVARADLHGLRCGLHAAYQWAAHDVPPVELVGVAVVADHPAGRPFAVQNEHLARLRAVLGAVWLIPWIDQLRAAGPETVLELPRPVHQLRARLATLPVLSPSQETLC